MRYGQFFVEIEKRTLFLPFPFNSTFETVFLALIAQILHAGLGYFRQS